MATKTSFNAMLIRSTVYDDMLSMRSVTGRARKYRQDLTDACKKIGVIPENIGVRITVEKLDDIPNHRRNDDGMDRK